MITESSSAWSSQTWIWAPVQVSLVRQRVGVVYEQVEARWIAKASIRSIGFSPAAVSLESSGTSTRSTHARSGGALGPAPRCPQIRPPSAVEHNNLRGKLTELRAPGDVAQSTPVTDREVHVAELLLCELTGIEMRELRDDYGHALERLVAAKIGGGEVAELPAPQPAIDLLAALEESVQAARKSRQCPGPTEAAGRRVRPRASTQPGDVEFPVSVALAPAVAVLPSGPGWSFEPMDSYGRG